MRSTPQRVAGGGERGRAVGPVYGEAGDIGGRLRDFLEDPAGDAGGGVGRDLQPRLQRFAVEDRPRHGVEGVDEGERSRLVRSPVSPAGERTSGSSIDGRRCRRRQVIGGHAGGGGLSDAGLDVGFRDVHGFRRATAASDERTSPRPGILERLALAERASLLDQTEPCGAEPVQGFARGVTQTGGVSSRSPGVSTVRAYGRTRRPTPGWPQRPAARPRPRCPASPQFRGRVRRSERDARRFALSAGPPDPAAVAPGVVRRAPRLAVRPSSRTAASSRPPDEVKLRSPADHMVAQARGQDIAVHGVLRRSLQELAARTITSALP